ncbi:MAG: hypothetical protein HY842_18430 [Bacteroidetes bacterium]|nr:hypothetical protein [Bacteroidota bacterium]
MLKANGIRTFADMAATSFQRYKELLKANGMSKFREPSPWAARAAELAKLPAPVPTPAPVQKAAAKAAEAPAKRNRQAKTVIDESLLKSRTKPQAAKAKAPVAPKAPPANPDDLTLVKGVGGRVAEALNREGIYTFKEMAATDLERYREILRANDMSKFRDPSDWAQLAGELVKSKK